MLHQKEKGHLVGDCYDLYIQTRSTGFDPSYCHLEMSAIASTLPVSFT